MEDLKLAECRLNNSTQSATSVRQRLELRQKKGFEDLIRFISENPQADLSLEVLSSRMNMSLFHFTRKFKAFAGVSPNQYIIACRVSCAKNYLLTSNFSVAKIAEKVGYESQSYFCAVFKREVGLTPLKYKKKQLESALLLTQKSLMMC